MTYAKNRVCVAYPPRQAFAEIFRRAAVSFGITFLVSGVLVDWLGGRRMLLVGVLGAAAANLAMGLGVSSGDPEFAISILGVAYPANLALQTLVVLSVLKIIASWFHVRERGVFVGLFGIVTVYGVYVAFDFNSRVTTTWPVEWVFIGPAILLLMSGLAVWAVVRPTPASAGFEGFETGDAWPIHTSEPLPWSRVIPKVLLNPVVLLLAAIGAGSGFMRQAVMATYPPFARAVGITGDYVPTHWLEVLACAGIVGGVAAGILSDRIFGSRRGPVAALLSVGLIAGSIMLFVGLDTQMVGWVIVGISVCAFGVNSLISAMAAMDFGGARHVGMTAGLIKFFTYQGVWVYSLMSPSAVSRGQLGSSPDTGRWWPVPIIVVAVMVAVLSAFLWRAKPVPARGSALPK